MNQNQTIAPDLGEGPQDDCANPPGTAEAGISTVA